MSISVEEGEPKEQHQLGEFDDDAKGFQYSRLGGKPKGSQSFLSILTQPHTIMLSILMLLLAGVIVLQVVQMVVPTTCGNIQEQINGSKLIQQVNDVTQSSAQHLIGIVNSLSNLEKDDATTKGAVDDILLVVEDLLRLQNQTSIISSHVPVSCKDIKKFDPDSPSGYYHLNSQLVYCEMEKLCNSTEGWTRVGFLDMSDSTSSCPDGWKLYQGQGIRACRRPSGGASCVSTKFQVNGIRYSEVCGRVTGYQYGSPDAVDTRFISTAKHNDINSYYVDGVSITHGNPRAHIWTLMAGVKESYSTKGNCPCNDPPGGTQSVQSFVGNDYFCESGNPTNSIAKKVYAVDPLWDGKGCGLQETGCCDAPGLPWFHKVMNSSTIDSIELRECGDQQSGDEDVLVSFYDIYIK